MERILYLANLAFSPNLSMPAKAAIFSSLRNVVKYLYRFQTGIFAFIYAYSAEKSRHLQLLN